MVLHSAHIYLLNKKKADFHFPNAYTVQREQIRMVGTLVELSMVRKGRMSTLFLFFRFKLKAYEFVFI